MPIYEYRCKKGHTFEVMQRMTEDSLASCTTCGAPVQRVFHSPAVHFKGSGFYTTDYGKKQSSGAKESKSDGASADSKSGSSSDSGSSDSGSSNSGSSDSDSSNSDSSDSSRKSKASSSSSSD